MMVSLFLQDYFNLFIKKISGNFVMSYVSTGYGLKKNGFLLTFPLTNADNIIYYSCEK